ncbi:MAG: methylated-DNA--[protein]-cysteine S-methyltransferase [Methanomethylophilus sp.]
MAPEHIHTYLTSLGMLSISSDGAVITGVYLPTENLPSLPEGTDLLMNRAAEEIGEYLSGRRKTFDLPAEQEGTEFQHQVWHAITAIPYGKTKTYGEIARQIGRPGAAQAVGTACGNNRLPLLIPCHRVTAADGLGRYAGGGQLKLRLLRLEHDLA